MMIMNSEQAFIFHQCVTLSDWTALTMKRGLLLEGTTLNGDPVIPFGVSRLLATGEVKLLLSWLAIGEETEAI